MASIEKSIEVNVAVPVAYEQLTQFEQFPRFMEGVERVARIDDTHLHWQTRVGGQDLEWDAEIMQVPDQHIAWRNTSGPRNEGRIDLLPLEQDKTRVTLSMVFDPEQSGHAEREIAQRTEEDLARFKKFVERNPDQAGVWRGVVHDAGEQREAVAGTAAQSGPRKPRSTRPPWLPNLLQAWDEPLTMMRKMSEDVDQMAQRFIGRPLYGSRARQGGIGPAWTPAVEVARQEDQFIVRADLPGVRREDVRIEIRSDKLTIEGDRHPEPTPQRPSRQPAEHPQEYRRSERAYGHFYRVIALPEGADEETARASMHDGLLEITVPLSPEARRGKRIDIQGPG